MKDCVKNANIRFSLDTISKCQSSKLINDDTGKIRTNNRKNKHSIR